jgi:ribosome modulation factor
MKKRRFTEEQIITILKLAEGGQKVGDICRTHGIRLYRAATQCAQLSITGDVSSVHAAATTDSRFCWLNRWGQAIQ